MGDADQPIGIPPGISKMQHAIFGNLLDLNEFHHNTFLKELDKYDHMPEEFGRCMSHGKFSRNTNSYLVKPLQRILKYPVLVKTCLKMLERF
ncbi:proto-oncogene DBL-like [Stigmatopora nigra]